MRLQDMQKGEEHDLRKSLEIDLKLLQKLQVRLFVLFFFSPRRSSYEYVCYVSYGILVSLDCHSTLLWRESLFTFFEVFQLETNWTIRPPRVKLYFIARTYETGSRDEQARRVSPREESITAVGTIITGSKSVFSKQKTDPKNSDKTSHERSIPMIVPNVFISFLSNRLLLTVLQYSLKLVWRLMKSPISTRSPYVSDSTQLWSTHAPETTTSYHHPTWVFQCFVTL